MEAQRKALEALLRAIRNGGGDSASDAAAAAATAGGGAGRGPSPSELRDMLRRLSSSSSSGEQQQQQRIRSHAQELLEQLGPESDPGAQYVALEEVCETLAVATEATFARVPLPPVDALVPALVALLAEGATPEIMLLAVRALANLVEALPPAAGVVAGSDAPAALCAKLLAVEFVDIAEQCLQLLERIAAEHPGAVLAAGGVAAPLEFCDFFTAASQRRAVAVAAAACRALRPDSFDALVRPSLPRFAALLEHSDRRVAAAALLALARVAEGLAEDEERLATAFSPELLGTLLSFCQQHAAFDMMPVAASPAAAAAAAAASSAVVARKLSASSGMESTPQQMPWHVLAMVCGVSKKVARQLLDAGAVDVICQALSNTLPLPPSPSGSGASAALSAATVTRSNTEDVLALVNVLLSDASSPALPQSPHSRRGGRRSGLTSSRRKASSGSLFRGHADQLLALVRCVLPRVVALYGSAATNSRAARLACLAAANKAIGHCPAGELLKLSRQAHISCALATVLASEDTEVSAQGLQIAESLVARLSSEATEDGPASIGGLATDFRREGVVHELDRIAASSSVDALASKAQEVLKALTSHAESGAAGDTADNHLAILRKLAADLRTASEEESSSFSVLRSVRDAVVGTSGDGTTTTTTTTATAASPFELAESGIFGSLLAFLAPSGSTASAIAERVKVFFSVFESAAHWQMLIAKLQDALEKSEKLPVTVGDMRGAGSGLRFIAQPLKIRLTREGDAAAQRLTQISDQTVNIEPLATMAAIEDYLWERVAPGGTDEEICSGGHRRRPSEDADEMMDDGEGEDEGEDDDGTSGRIRRRRSRDGDGDDPMSDGEGDGDTEHGPEYVKDVDTRQSSPSTTRHHNQHVQTEAEAAAAAAAATATTAATTTPAQPRRQQQPEMRLAIIVGGRVLGRTTSIFEALLNTASHDGGSHSVHQLWETVHPVIYRRATPDDAAAIRLANDTAGGITADRFARTHITSCCEDSTADAILRMTNEPPLDLAGAQKGSDLGDILGLLRVLHTMMSSSSSSSPSLSPVAAVQETALISQRLSEKLSRQLTDALAACSGALPGWCRSLALRAPFLFSLDVRQLFLVCSDCGIPRALHAIGERLARTAGIPGSGEALFGGDEGRERRMSRVPKLKVRVSRERVLEGAIKVMDLGTFRSVLEVEYHGEAGTGLGPTQEFYTLVSRELQRDSLGLWMRDSVTSDGHVVARGGLFPAPRRGPLPQSESAMWRFVGAFCAKALIDKRLLDLPLATPFLRWLVGKPLSLADLVECNPTVGANLFKLAAAARTHSRAIDGVPVEDLCLDFTLPGDPAWELVPGGTEIGVTESNLGEYVDAVLQAMLGSGVSEQLSLFAAGFSRVLPIAHLSLFSPAELYAMLCGAGDDEPWEKTELLEATKFEFGYSASNRVVQDLMDVMAEFGPADRRQFLLFLTGTPRLPVGGFRALSPRFTVVRKAHQPPESPDALLPSVNACFYYLKLPEYTCKAVLRERLLFTIHNGQGSFDLT